MFRSLHTSIALSVLFAVVLTTTMPHFCATGWCCSERQATEHSSDKASCCATKVEKQQEGSCCRTASTNQKPQTEKQGCATGCCKIVSLRYMLSAPQMALVVPPVTELESGDMLNTGIELSDYIPQPPRVLSV